MEIILLDHIGGLGKLGDKVTVKPGYARNFLIPYGKAQRATPASLAAFESRRSELEKQSQDRLTAAKALGDSLSGLLVQIERKASIDGRLFGSVTNMDIFHALEAMNFNIGRSAIQMPDGVIKNVGDFHITVELHSEVRVSITVSVLGDHN